MIDTVSHFTPEPDADIVEEKKTLIGEGSTSICYKVRYNGKWFSKKQLKPEYKNFQLYRSALRKEYELGSRIDCPYVVHYSDIGEDRDGPYILTDYVDGQPLSKFIDDNPDYFKSRHARKRFTDELFSAVECLHTHQILHLDLTPSNILITKIEHHVKLIDYGFSYQDSYTETTGGTPGYSAPEQFTHEYPISAASDIYAIGNLLKEFHLSNSRIIARCLKDNPDERYQSAEDLHRAINSHKRSYLFTVITIIILLSAIIIIRNCNQPKIIYAKYSKLCIPIDKKSKMSVSTVVLDSTSQPPLAGGVVQNFDSSEIAQKGMLIGMNPDDMFLTDTTKAIRIDDLIIPQMAYNRATSIIIENIKGEDFIFPIPYLLGDMDYYIKAFVITRKRKVIYGEMKKIHTLNFSRYDGTSDVANVFHTSDYTAFDLETDEIMDIEKDGCFYSSNENPKLCIRNTDIKATGYYKFKTRWNYKLWYSIWGINNHYWKSYDTRVYKPVMRMEDGELIITPDNRNAKDKLNFYYTVNGDWQRPENFRLKYTGPIKITHPCAIHCYAIRNDGCISFTNSYVKL
jgi:serine/threonine protein kinase